VPGTALQKEVFAAAPRIAEEDSPRTRRFDCHCMAYRAGVYQPHHFHLLLRSLALLALCSRAFGPLVRYEGRFASLATRKMWIKSLHHPLAFARGFLGPLVRFTHSR